jgi:DNA-binding transcriptional LysR family regulator
MEIRHLKYMVAVTDEGQFHRAAKRLHIVPPALSQNIRQLEEEIGTPLFKRTTRHLELTSAGRIFYEQALGVLRQLESMPHDALRAAAGTTGTITLGFTETAVFGPFREIMRRFHLIYPRVRIVTRECSPSSLFERLNDGTIDIACSEECVLNAHQDAVRLPAINVVVALHQTHPLANETTPLPLAQLEGESFILPTQNSNWSVYEMLARALAAAGVTPRQEYGVDSAISGIALVAGGLGVCLVPGFTPSLHKEVVYRTVLPRLRLTPQIVWMKSNRSPAVANFVSLAQKRRGHGRAVAARP